LVGGDVSFATGLAVGRQGDAYLIYELGANAWGPHVARFDPGGQLREGFPALLPSPGGDDRNLRSSAVATDGEGGLVVVASRYLEPGPEHLVVWRTDADAQVAPGFPVTWAAGDSTPSVWADAVVVDAERNVWVTGAVKDRHGDYYLGSVALWRFDTEGRLAAGFPVLWAIDYPDAVDRDSRPPPDLWATDVVLDPEASVWTVGYVPRHGAPGVRVAAWKYAVDGLLLDGFPKLPAGSDYDYVGYWLPRAAAAPDGTIWLTSGLQILPEEYLGSLWRLDSDGEVIAGYPWTAADAQGGRADFHDVAVDPAGCVWIGGSVFDEDGLQRLAVWKHTPDGDLVDGFPFVADADLDETYHLYVERLAIGTDGTVWVDGRAWPLDGEWGRDESFRLEERSILWRFE